jgi:hypothetical protein
MVKDEGYLESPSWSFTIRQQRWPVVESNQGDFTLGRFVALFQEQVAPGLSTPQRRLSSATSATSAKMVLDIAMLPL